MKQVHLIALGIGFLSIPLATMAVDKIDGPVDDDLFFPRGVLIEDVDPPSDPEANTLVSSVKIEGVGTVTVADARIGDFPRMMVSGGTKITSSRKWTEEDTRKTWWEGQFTAPSSGRLPKLSDIEFKGTSKEGDDFTIVDTFQWGLPNETFNFSPAAAVVLPVNEKDGIKLKVAYPQDNNTWKITTDDYCYVQNGLCALEISKINALSLIKESFSECPRDEIKNGVVGSVPECAITCNGGYELSDDGKKCLSMDDDFIDEEEFIDEGYYGDEEMAEDFEGTTAIAEDTPDIRPGYIKFRGTRDQLDREVDEEGLTGDDLETVRKLNAGRLGRVSEGGSEEVGGEMAEGDMKDGFINYVLQMRNKFGEGGSSNTYPHGELAMDTHEEGEAVAAEEVVHGSAPLLPSTGPELFALVAIAGLGLMVFGAMRKKD